MSPSAPPAAPAVLGPREAAAQGVARVGGKAAGLARLAGLGVEVPAWVVVPVAAFQAFRAPWHAALTETLAVLTPQTVGVVATALQRLVYEAPLTPGFEAALAEAIARHLPGARRLAVRSSAPDEDAAQHAFAGLHDSFLGVRPEDLAAALKACWASAYTERALRYRLSRGLSLGDMRMAVVVQAMAEGDVSGVLFTANAASGRREEALVSAVYGLGEGLVSGALAADHWVLDREAGTVSATVAAKTARVVPVADGGTEERPVPPEAAMAPALEEAEVRALVALGDRLARAIATPLDIEWTRVAGRWVVLQARPITTLGADEPRVRWDNSNIAESYPGVTTPLTFSFVRGVYRVAYQVMLRAFGVSPRWIDAHQPVFENLLGLLNGRIYYNLSQYYRLGEFFPAKDAMKDAFDTMIGVKQRQAFRFEPRGAWRFLTGDLPQMAALVAMVGWRYVDWARENDRFEARFEALFRNYQAIAWADAAPETIVAAYRALERELLWGWRAPMVNDFYAMAFFGALRSLVTRWALDPDGTLANDLLCGEGGFASTAPIAGLEALAAEAAADPALAAAYAEGDEAVMAAIAEGRFPAYARSVASYLDRWGYRCVGELKLEVPNLRDDPRFLHAMVRRYMAGPAADAAARARREAAVRAEAEGRVAARLRGPRAWLFGWVTANARRGVRERERLRMARSNTFGLIRTMFLGLGTGLCRLGALDAREDVFYLALDELFAYVEGRSVTQDLRALVAIRRDEYAAHAAMPVAGCLETVGPPYAGGQLVPPAEAEVGAVLRGTGCCPGRVEAPARVVAAPTPDTRLAGEILVAERTDPGWVLLYPLASGLLIERGSLLSHAAVTARELGLPAVIGVEGLMRAVKDGQRLRMDGRAGTVECLEEARVEEARVEEVP